MERKHSPECTKKKFLLFCIIYWIVYYLLICLFVGTFLQMKSYPQPNLILRTETSLWKGIVHYFVECDVINVEGSSSSCQLAFHHGNRRKITKNRNLLNNRCQLFNLINIIQQLIYQYCCYITWCRASFWCSKLVVTPIWLPRVSHPLGQDNLHFKRSHCHN